MCVLRMIVLCSACIAFLACDSHAWAATPNVIVLLTDDQGWGDLSLHGNQNIDTPNLDRLGRVGARLDRFYVCPVCAPTRAEFLTGRYHPRGGVRGVTRGEERLDLDEKTIAEHFKSAGYSTAVFGKWHNGMQYPYHPNARGFEEFYGYCSGHWGDYFSPQLEHNGRLVKGDGYLVDDFTNQALEFMEENRTNPFFLYLAMPTPHSPMQVPDKFWDRHRDREPRMRADAQYREDLEFTKAALAMVECIDENVGRLFQKLDELGLAEETIVVFFCDNGPNSYRWNGGMKGKKGSTDEGGVRSPCFVSWPGKIRSGQVVAQIASGIDLLPTLCDLAEVPVVGGKPLDGISLAPLLTGKAAAIPDRLIFSHWNRKVSVRTQHHRMDHRGNLYDMLLDPAQQRPIQEDQPVIARELSSFVQKWESEVLQEMSEQDERPFPVGHPDFRWTQLPARDADFTGAIERSASAPNCSYLKNWTKPEEEVSWNVEIIEPGRFEAEMYYACVEAGVGVEIELSLETSGGTVRLDSQDADRTSTKRTAIAAGILEANDPPAVGSEHDRVPRKTQSLMKDFRPLRLGAISLPRGPARLVLRAREVTEAAKLEMRMLYLSRIP